MWVYGCLSGAQQQVCAKPGPGHWSNLYSIALPAKQMMRRSSWSLWLLMIWTLAGPNQDLQSSTTSVYHHLFCCAQNLSIYMSDRLRCYLVSSRRDKLPQTTCIACLSTCFPVQLMQCKAYSVYLNMVSTVHAVCAGDTTAELLTLAHSDLDYRLYLPLSRLMITKLPWSATSHSVFYEYGLALYTM